ncbi:TMV resistance protein N-like [Punica granatum]|uniref:TMV resistance protein N-like n=1 Tax=Punica granatum TaxID=22663 RepID=A0A6P8D733_PUNGR|nr:TMV resistance protein N-like [Punica granatum]
MLNPDDALQLFSSYAFENESPSQAFRELSVEVVSATDGVPLALVVIGSLLHKYKDPQVWKDIIKRSAKIPFDAVNDRLRISYDNLKSDQKQIFLDIACFFIGTEKTNPIYMWDACEYCPRWALAVLCSRSLVKILDNDQIWMHDQLKDLGRDIVCEDILNDPKKCSRKEATQVVKSKKTISA